TAVVTSRPPPANTAPPMIGGTAQAGQTLTGESGSWTNEPTSFAYQWQRCDAAGSNCSPVTGGAGQTQTYVLGPADVGFTSRVTAPASNAGGPSAPASSAPTALVQPAPATATLGKTTIGASSDYFAAERKRVNRYALTAAGSLTKLSVYLAPH